MSKVNRVQRMLRSSKTKYLLQSTNDQQALGITTPDQSVAQAEHHDQQVTSTSTIYIVEKKIRESNSNDN